MEGCALFLMPHKINAVTVANPYGESGLQQLDARTQVMAAWYSSAMVNSVKDISPSVRGPSARGCTRSTGILWRDSILQSSYTCMRDVTKGTKEEACWAKSRVNKRCNGSQTPHPRALKRIELRCMAKQRWIHSSWVLV